MRGKERRGIIVQRVFEEYTHIQVYNTTYVSFVEVVCTTHSRQGEERKGKGSVTHSRVFEERGVYYLRTTVVC